MKKQIFAAMLLAIALCACGKQTDLHYLETTTAPAETEATAPSPAPFLYTPSDDGVLSYNARQLIGKWKDFQYQDGYLYFIAGGSSTGNPKLGLTAKRLVRMNVETGNVTAVCPDPLCEHDRTSACSMYGIGLGGFIVGPDGKYYIWKIDLGYTESDFSESFWQYDAEQDTLMELSRDMPGHIKEFYTERYRFTHNTIYNEETKTSSYCITRYDLTTGESIPLFDGEQSETETDEMLFIIGDRLYLTDYDCLYSVNFDGEDRRVHIEGRVTRNAKTDGTYVYYVDQYEICRRHLDNGEEERLGIFPYLNHFELTENYIYYRTGEDIVIGKASIKGYTSDVVTLGGENFCRYALDGSTGEEIVYTFAGETADLRPTSWVVAGNYCYATFSRWVDPDGDGVYRDHDEHYSTPSSDNDYIFSFLRIDLTTGAVDTIAVDDHGVRMEGAIK